MQHAQHHDGVEVVQEEDGKAGSCKQEERGHHDGLAPVTVGENACQGCQKDPREGEGADEQSDLGVVEPEPLGNLWQGWRDAGHAQHGNEGDSKDDVEAGVAEQTVALHGGCGFRSRIFMVQM